MPKYDNHSLKPEKHISITVMFTHHLTFDRIPQSLDFIHQQIAVLSGNDFNRITVFKLYRTFSNIKFKSHYPTQWLQNLPLSTPTPMLFKICQPKQFSLAFLITFVDDFCLIIHVNSFNVSVNFKMTFSNKLDLF